MVSLSNHEVDLPALVRYQALVGPGEVHRAGEQASLQAGTGAWAELGR